MNANPESLLSFVKLSGVLPALVVAMITLIAGRFVSQGLDRLGKRFNERRILLQQIGTLSRLGIIFAGFLFAASLVFSFSQEALLAIGGTAAVSLGFAFKDLVASSVAGVIILIDRPFQVGDRVAFEDTYGEIRKIGLRTTRLQTLDDNIVTIPNSKFLSDVVSSGNAGDLAMQVVTDFLVDPNTDIAAAKEALRFALLESPYTYLRSPWSILVSQESKQTFVATQLRLKAYVLDTQYEKAFQSDLTERVLERFTAAGVQVPAQSHLRKPG